VTGSIFETALGAEAFACLHPMMQRRFGVSLEAGYACVGRGTMARIRRGPWWTVPFLLIGRLRHILVADTGSDVPFTIENYPYRDPFGRETVTFVREYRVRRRPARFDATMVLDPVRRVVVDYLGTHQHLAVDLELEVDDRGGLVLRSSEQRFYEGPVGFRFPMAFSGTALLREHWDDERQAFRISLEVHNRVLGFLFGYEGWFSCEFPPATDAPERLKPRRHERRL
jgi:CubicO group peptidase (beta-lactamase class C family)